MTKWKAITEGFRALFKGPFTVRYPLEPSPPPEAFRGAPKRDSEKCTACGACVQNCPTGAISILDLGRDVAVNVWYGKCIFCARCTEVCPEEAVKMSLKYDLSTYNKNEVQEQVSMAAYRCQECGKLVTSERHVDIVIDRVKVLPLPLNYVTTISLCSDCRRRYQASQLLGLRVKVRPTLPAPATVKAETVKAEKKQ
ncbi:MAG: 4Fe-4S binding protein [Candidatus Nezhaarchaeota archaeon]|nr:4Fe-4S binding protein [Candidatus Nezhaarchaeota archaeon]MCX8141254.1 4Fe-4S binding protein [Candidatus Nezhaarchaeota archaeon]MDW8049520.1 4Fe-4S binding protein [Nitrososphaerota archaeon]